MKTPFKALLYGLFILLFALPAYADRSDHHQGRGNPADYDSGPEKGSDLLQILNDTPNYRTIGRTVMGKDQDRTPERFRWHWGPVRYRGRTGTNQVKVLIIGQEGGQDEAFSKRAFTGGTGQSMQQLLNYLGVTDSYLFLNTFIYSIRGQYRDKSLNERTGLLKLANAYKGDYWMAQNLDSPIVKHRHLLFNKVVEMNPDLRLVIAVGGGAKDTVQTWVKANGGTCKKKGKVETCDGSVISPNVKLLGVLHPGMAGQGKLRGKAREGLSRKEIEEKEREMRKKLIAKLERDFQRAADVLAQMLNDEPEWLPLDEGGTRPEIGTVERERHVKKKVEIDGEMQTITEIIKYETIGFEKIYKYFNEPAPYKDFAFGSMWTMGNHGTRSNRSMDQRSITLFSDAGKYGNGTVKFPERGSVRRTGIKGSTFETSGYSAEDGEVPFEPPRVNPDAFDPGPGAEWAPLLMGQEKGFKWPDFKRLGAISHESFGTGPIYRGRLNEARVLIVADQKSHDDIVRGRALLGDGGQKIQHFLKQMGITQSYAIIRTLPVDTLGLSFDDVEKISKHRQVTKVRKEILKRILKKGNTQIILTFGSHAKNAVRRIRMKDKPTVYELKSISSRKAANNWTYMLKRILREKKYESEAKTKAFNYRKGTWSDIRLQINRYDLPFGTVKWFGTSGSLASRSLNHEGDYYQLSMPQWASRWKATRLTEGEYEDLKVGGWIETSR